MKVDNKHLNTSKALSAPKRAYTQLDYARHMPKAYVERIKRTIPRKIYDNRFGAPAVIKYHIHPDDYIPSTEGRPWENKVLQEVIEKENKYFGSLLHNKFYQKKFNKIKPIPEQEWTIFPGDTVQVMVGKHRGKTGIVTKVLRESNSVFLDGLHTQLQREMEKMEKYNIQPMYKWQERPLDYSKGQVMLVDPQDKEPCTARWVINESKTEWIRISNRSAVEIPIPSQAKITYEYITPNDYIEVEAKDTTAVNALKRTYTPKLCLVEQELMEEMGIKEDRKPLPTYWY